MAIQISGTTVINNSRQLKNIASLDSTTTSTIAAAAGGGGVTSIGFGFNTSNIAFGWVSSHTRFTKTLEPDGVIFAFGGNNSTVTLYQRPSATSSSGQTTLATAYGAIAYINTGSTDLEVWVNNASTAFVLNF